MSNQPVHVWGSGDRAVLVHGAVSAGQETWQAQQPLAEDFELVVPDRHGYDVPNGEGPDSPERDVDLLIDLLDKGAHLVGYSAGSMVAMLAAARVPQLVRSLVLIEPIAFDLVRGRDDVEHFIAEYDRIHTAAPDAEQFLREFLIFFGASREEIDQVPSPLPDGLRQAATAQFTGASPWVIRTPHEALAAAPFPITLVSGGHSELFEAICDKLAELVDARREVVPGAGHGVQYTGEPFNTVLRKVWSVELGKSQGT